MMPSIRQLKDNNGAYMWQSSLVAGEPDKLLGYDTLEREIEKALKG